MAPSESLFSQTRVPHRIIESATFNSSHRRRYKIIPLLLLYIGFLLSCGGGGGGGSSSPAPSTTLTLSLQNSSLTITPGTNFSVLITAATNASAAATISLGTLPAGLNCSNAFPMTVPAGGATLNFTAGPNLADGNYNIVVNGQAGTTTAQTTLAVTIEGSTGLSLMLGTATGYAGQGAGLNVTSGAPVGYTGLMSLSFSSLPPGITVPGQPLIVIPGAQQIGIAFDSSAAAGNYTLDGTLTAGNQHVSASNTVTVLAQTGITSNASNIDIIPGGTATVTLTCRNSTGSSCTLQGTVSGLPTGLTITPGPPWQITSQGISLVFAAASSLPVGLYPVTFTGTNGSYSTSLVLNFYVNNANFTLVAPMLTQTAVRKGSSASVVFQINLNVLPGGVANFALDMSVTGLSQGTTAVFSPSHLTPGGTTTLTVSAATNALTAYSQGLIITATPTINSLLPQSVGISLDVVPSVGSLPSSRADFINVDGSQLSGIFDPLHGLAFVSNPDYNRVDVVSIAKKSAFTSIQAPKPASLTLSLDGTKVIVGTDTSQVLWIDTTSLQVTKKYQVPPYPTNPPLNPPAAPYVHELSDGTLLVVPQPNEQSLMIVNPSTGQVTTRTPPGFGLEPGLFAVNDRGTKIVLVSDGNPLILAVYDVATRSFVSTSYGGPSVKTMGIDAGGTHVLVGGVSFDMYDISLNHLGSINIGQTLVLVGGLFSPDGKTAYIEAGIGSAGPPMIYTVDVASLTPTSLASSTGSIPFYADASGLIVGAEPFGVTLDDATFNIPSPAAAGQVPGLVPSVGPIGQETQTQLGASSGYAVLPDVYFGSQLSPHESLQIATPYTATVTAPASSIPGPVNVKFVWPNGTESFLPLGFSYGPWIEKVLTNEASPMGGGSASLVALGIPSDTTQVQLRIGGSNAPITGSGQPNNYLSAATKLTFSPPPGMTGPADISLTTANGTTTINGAFRYLQSVQNYVAPVNGTVYHSLLFNPKLNEVYLSAGDHADVFSTGSMSFGSPLNSAPLAGKTLGGMAISPDGNTLYVTDTTDGTLLVADAKNLSAGATAIPIAPASVENNCLYGPVFVAVTSNSKAYVTYDTSYAGSCTPGAIPTSYVVDLQTRAVSTPSFGGSNCAGDTVTSSDGTELAISPVGGYGFFCVYDVASGNVHTLDSGGQYGGFNPNGLAVSGDGARVAFGESSNNSWVVATASANVVSFAHAPALFSLNDLPLTSMKLTDSGSLLYVLYPQDLDIFDATHGTLQRRLSLTDTAKAQLDSLAVDPYGERAFVLTDGGLTVITLDAVPLSVSTLRPSIGPAGTSVAVRGSGFDNQTTATLNGVSASVTLVDGNTLTLMVPTGVSGMQRLALSNPDGQSYTLEGAFTEQ